MGSFNLISLFVGLIALWIIGLQDLRTREITWSWLYTVVLIAALFSGGNWIIKGICLIVVPLLLMLCAYWMAIAKAKRVAKQAGVPYVKPEDIMDKALSYFGGADIKTIAVAGALCGPYWLAAGLVAGIIVCCIPFLKRPSLGLRKELSETAEDEYKERVPFCFLLVVGLTLIVCLSSLL